MMISPDPRQERASTYVVQDLSSQEELQRLQLQEPLITAALGGVLPEQSEPTRFRQVLDAACGTGGWLVELAQTYPSITQLVGVDISKYMVNTASAVAESYQLRDRISFRIMDILHLFDLQENTFDLVNMRFAASFLRSWEWPQALGELRRVTAPGGIIRVTECDLPYASSSPALMTLCRLLAQAYEYSGKYFGAQAYGISDELAGLLTRQGLRNVQTRVYRPEIKAGTVNGLLFFEDMKALFRTNMPFLRKWIKVPDDYEEVYEQMLAEIQQPDFVVNNQTITAWGEKA